MKATGIVRCIDDSVIIGTKFDRKRMVKQLVLSEQSVYCAVAVIGKDVLQTKGSVAEQK